MTIAIKSEIDSRVVVYPLMWTLKPFGSVLVISNNKQLLRLIDDQEYMSFRDMTVIVDESSGADDIYEQYGIAPNDYDFIILDRVAAIDFDKCLILLGNKQSEIFEEDLKAVQGLMDKRKYILVDFGTSSASKDQKQKAKPKPKPSKKATTKKAATDELTEPEVADEAEVEVEETEEEYDPTEKFRALLPEEAAKREQLKVNKVKFPTFSDIEKVEGDHKFYQVGMDLAKVFFQFLGEPLAIAWDKFSKEARRRDESSSNGQK